MQKQPPEVFYKKCILKNLEKFTGKHLYQSLFFNKVASLGPATLLKKRLWHRCFPVNFSKFLRTLFYKTLLDDCFWQCTFWLSMLFFNKQWLILGIITLTHWSNLFGNFFQLLIWELMDATPTNNRIVLRRSTVTLSQNTPGCICLWALPSPCCQRVDYLFLWILTFDAPGLVRPARSWNFRQYRSHKLWDYRSPTATSRLKIWV